MAKLQELAYPRYCKITITQDALGNDIETLAAAGASAGKAVNANVALITARTAMQSDNSEGEVITKYTGGTITFGIDGFTLPVKADIMGNEITDGELITSEDDIAPYVRFGYITGGEIINRVKNYIGNVFYKALFAPSSESHQTGGATPAFATDTISGTLSRNNAKRFKAEKQFTTEAEALAYIDSFLNILENIVVVSEAGATDKTAITVAPGKLVAAHTYVYKTGATVTLPAYGALLSDWTLWDGSAEITATTGNEIAIAEVNAANKAVAVGKATVVSG